jgi:hypothetical protein
LISFPHHIFFFFVFVENRANERSSFFSSKQSAGAAFPLSANVRQQPKRPIISIKRAEMFRIEEKNNAGGFFVKNVLILAGTKQRESALVQSVGRNCKPGAGERFKKQEKMKDGFAFIAVSSQLRLHHYRPVERRHVVDVVRPTVPLEV